MAIPQGQGSCGRQGWGNDREHWAYSMPCWKTMLNNSMITLGCNNIFGQDPPESPGNFNSNTLNYPGFSYDNLGRFWYIELKKKF